MTALEQQLTTALRRLSEQYAQEQQRQTAQVETLRQQGEQQAVQVEALQQQVEQLAGQMTRLAADYRTLAATLRGRWNCCASTTGSADRNGTTARAAKAVSSALRAPAGARRSICGTMSRTWMSGPSLAPR